ncbi:tRNA 2-thiouridine(34) synthase MnmA [Mycoplasmoides genitalium]|uniref:tRNA-specific 2-thiouridylase MnmA n=1 Tax=Mycoplasma genitalium (strain ATCC 33530 / DSM 19775 / NCTC 10195 / G37) TaxID=243273 RepID=MNMA_MYCGE|nr:RecName: Full=tRNA-specific 2-thiouridylase MnmA [Mycoplasmoides genitalium G37]AAC71516.1 tRNA (5-methylaminomethyl-2-thiouridylate)-methyltransferase [Mycoplasmoides genitalium G37]ABY79490.1 tRNA (5-methylaminomethyl-2-thiouridylate)-methyltransferase [synthetic Mycoplasma genitalium JCVI-1.0]
MSIIAKTVFIGLSGGVDSAVSALLLKKQYQEVIGVFMECWDETLNNDFYGHKKINNNKSGCSSFQDFQQAKKIANSLGIKLIKKNLIEAYWNKVFLPMIQSFKKGLTPNPDIWCNRFIKFGLLHDFCKQINPNSLFATGHYAKINMIENQPLLSIPKDTNKDQTYFLANVKKEQFQNVIFPLADLKKITVRNIARENNWEVADKKDSTGICFIGERHFSDFLKNYLPVKKGLIKDWKTKQTISEHDGVWFYTIGQRSGLNLGGLKQRHFVVAKDIETNELFVSCDKEELLKTTILLDQFNWLYTPKQLPSQVLVRIRHAQKPEIAKLKLLSDNKLEITFKNPVISVASGQFGVLYTLDQICLGAGLI